MADPIRVLQLGSPSGLYGAEHWILALIRHLDPRRVQSFVAAVKDAPDAEAPVCRVAREHGFASFVVEASGRFNLSAVGRLRDLIRAERIDIVHTHGYKTDLLGLLAARAAGRAIVATPHGWTDRPDFKLALYERFDRLLFMFCDAIAPLSPALHRSVEQVPLVRKKLFLITNAVDLDEVSAQSDLPRLFSGLKERGILTIGVIGRLVHGKGIDIILRAMAEYGRPEWRLVLIGAGQQEAELKELAHALRIESRVDFLGFRSDRLAYLKGFDVFVLASLSEGTPRCVMEAMAAGVPVVASDIEGCRNLIRDGETGILFRPGEAEALAGAIHRLTSDPALRQRVTAAASALVAEKYSAARMARDYERLFTKIAATVRR